MPRTRGKERQFEYIVSYERERDAVPPGVPAPPHTIEPYGCSISRGTKHQPGRERRSSGRTPKAVRVEAGRAQRLAARPGKHQPPRARTRPLGLSGTPRSAKVKPASALSV